MALSRTAIRFEERRSFCTVDQPRFFALFSPVTLSTLTPTPLAALLQTKKIKSLKEVGRGYDGETLSPDLPSFFLSAVLSSTAVPAESPPLDSSRRRRPPRSFIRPPLAGVIRVRSIFHPIKSGSRNAGNERTRSTIPLHKTGCCSFECLLF